MLRGEDQGAATLPIADGVIKVVLPRVIQCIHQGQVQPPLLPGQVAGGA